MPHRDASSSYFYLFLIKRVFYWEWLGIQREDFNELRFVIGIMFVEKMEKLYKRLLGTELCSTFINY